MDVARRIGLAFAVLVLLGVATGYHGQGAADNEEARSVPSRRPIVIVMVGDGMGRGALDAASAFRTGRTGQLFLEQLPRRARMATRGLDAVTDSAASATAMATGVLTSNERVGQDRDGRPLPNLTELARSRGLATGIVTTSSLPHATPAAFTVHCDSRDRMEHIAERLVEAPPEVMLGGGAGYFGIDRDRFRREGVLRLAGRHVQDHAVVTSWDELDDAVEAGARRIAGLFAEEHMPFVFEAAEDAPPLAEMALAALATLDRAPGGFFLMIEGGRIDMAAHENDLPALVGEVLAFDDAVRTVAYWAHGREDVLLLVTADHETGGLRVEHARGREVLPDVSWRTREHTGDDVDLYAMGEGSELLDGAAVDPRWVHAIASARIEGRKASAPPPGATPPTLVARAAKAD